MGKLVFRGFAVDGAVDKPGACSLSLEKFYAHPTSTRPTQTGKEAAMLKNLFVAISLFFITMVAAFSATAQEKPVDHKKIVTGTGVACDTREQLEAYAKNFSNGKNVEESVARVNGEVGGTACAMLAARYVVLEKTAYLELRETKAQVARVSVVGVRHQFGWLMLDVQFDQFILLPIGEISKG